MTKIEAFKQADAMARRMRGFADSLQTQREAGRYYVDKFGAEVSIGKTHKGDYGSSSVYEWDKAIVKLMEREITNRLRQIAVYAAETAEREAMEAAKAARDEAMEVLQNLDTEDA